MSTPGAPSFAKDVFLVRHGETTQTLSGVLIGSTDVPLSERGVVQAKRMAVFLRSRGIVGSGVCLASPLARARATADVVARALGIEVVVDPDLREVDFGAWEGLTSVDVQRTDPEAFARWSITDDDFGFPEGENVRSYLSRMTRAAGRITAERHSHVVVCAHAGVVRGLAYLLLGLERRHFWSLNPDLASITWLQLYPFGAVLSGLWPGSLPWEC